MIRPTRSPGRLRPRPCLSLLNREADTLKTLLVSDIFPPKTGGSGRWFWEIYRRQSRYSYTIAAGQHPRQREFDSRHELRVVRLPLWLKSWGIVSFEGLWGYARAIGRLRRLVAREGIEMVHCGRCLPEGVMGLALKLSSGVPFACYVHGEDVGTARDSREHRWLVDCVFRGASFLIANSRNTERILLQEWRGICKSLFVCFDPGVDTDRFQPAAPDGRTLRAVLGWENRPVILTVGRACVTPKGTRPNDPSDPADSRGDPTDSVRDCRRRGGADRARAVGRKHGRRRSCSVPGRDR